MQTTPVLEAIEDWLIREALGEPDTAEMFAGLCQRMNASGIRAERAMLSWATLHPLIEAETVLWLDGGGIELAQHRHEDANSDEWLNSPIRAMLERGDLRLRCPLFRSNAPFDYPLFHSLADQGFTDYLAIATPFALPTAQEVGASGIVVTWATRAPEGFDQTTIEQIEYLQMRLALACRATIQTRIAQTLADTYLGRRAGSQVLAGRIRHGDGESLDAVIFYTDLRGSTALAERLDPDAYLRVLNGYFDAAAGEVMARGGEVLDFIGDAVLAVFPIEAEGLGPAARQALAAARAVHARLSVLPAPGATPLACGIGLTCGPVMFGNIGVPDRLTFSVIGRTVNAAARIEAKTKELREPVLVTEEVAAADPGSFRGVGRFALTGVDRPVELFALRQPSSTSDPAPR